MSVLGIIPKDENHSGSLAHSTIDPQYILLNKLQNTQLENQSVLCGGGLMQIQNTLEGESLLSEIIREKKINAINWGK